MGHVHIVISSLALSNFVLATTVVQRNSDAAAAYCYANNGKMPNPTLLLTCAGAGVSNCSVVEKNNAKIVKTFTGPLPRHTTGYIAIDEVRQGTKGLIVVAFRGTKPQRVTTTDLFTNVLSLTQVSASLYCFDCTAARGYFEAYMFVNKTVIESVVSQLSTTGQKGYQVVTTGHSLGGALATFAALELRRLNIPVHLASYGMLRIGNSLVTQLTTNFDPVTSKNPTHNTLSQRNYRLTHVLDFIPDSIPESLGTFQYRHVVPGCNITAPGNIQPSTDNIVIIDDVSINNWGSALGNYLNPIRHSFYFGMINMCI